MGQYLQNITKRLDMGAEIFYQRGAQVPGNQIGIYTLAGRYKGMSCFSENYQLQVGTHCKRDLMNSKKFWQNYSALLWVSHDGIYIDRLRSTYIHCSVVHVFAVSNLWETFAINLISSGKIGCHFLHFF